MRFRFKALAPIVISLLFFGASWGVSQGAIALTPVRLFDLSYQECPPELSEGAITSWGNGKFASCYLIVGKAENKSGKPVIDADVFGRIYDANNNPVLQNRTRVGSIDEIPPGISDFSIRITVPSNQPTPLQLEQFKASGFSARVSPLF